MFYPTAEEETNAIRRAVARVGCDVGELAILDSPIGRHSFGRIECDDGWAAARLLLALACEDAKTNGARQIARALRARAPGDQAFARAVHAFVKSRVRFAREAGEIFQGPDVTFRTGVGDCDDHFRPVYAIARAGGLRAAEGLLHRGGNPTHVAAMLVVDGRPWWAETTVDAAFGEHPVAAAKRLGLRRDDITDEVRIMTERDLPPAPQGFAAANPQEQVERDAEAMRRLGFLVESEIAFFPGQIHPALMPWFRNGVARVQSAANGAAGPIDGLMGPRTRAWIASMLTPDEFGMGYIADAAAPVVPKLTTHLSNVFFREVEALAKRFRARGANVTGEDFLSVWLGESGVLHARRGRKVPCGVPSDLEAARYYGLNMMHEKFLRRLGYQGLIDAYCQLPAEEQIPWVERFYEQNVRGFLRNDWSKLSNASALYMMNWVPAFISHADDPEWVIARKGDAATGFIYDGNPGFDPEKKGYMVVADIQSWIDRNKASNKAYWAELVARLGSGGVDAPPTVPSGGAPVLIAIGIGLAGLAYAAHRYGYLG